MERTILHSDLNNFYASVECMLDPRLQNKPVAVGGNEAERHGIILAKNAAAKMCGVRTGEPLWQARRKCRELVIVPPHHEQYLKYSRLCREIYAEYTDQVEPFGIDECWLDVTGSGVFGSGEKIANEIRERVKGEIGLTVSLGVSFCKVFAKLGSDMKKPDAVTVIPRESFRERIWGLPASDMLGVGRATDRVLAAYGIKTIGDIARSSPELLRRKLGQHGITLYEYANGADASRVEMIGFEAPVKSVGHGITTRRDLINGDEVRCVMLMLTQDIAHKLRACCKRAGGVQIDIKNNRLKQRQWQRPLRYRTNSASVIAQSAFELFARSYAWEYPVRAVTVRAIDLRSDCEAEQLDMFGNASSVAKRERVEDAVEAIRARFGEGSIRPAVLCFDNGSIPRDIHGAECFTT